MYSIELNVGSTIKRKSVYCSLAPIFNIIILVSLIFSLQIDLEIIQYAQNTIRCLGC